MTHNLSIKCRLLFALNEEIGRWEVPLRIGRLSPRRRTIECIKAILDEKDGHWLIAGGR